MGLFFIVLGSVYMMVVHYGDVSRTEHSRLRMQQESRYMMTNFTQELQDAGAVLTHITSARWGESAYFNGIYPLNQTDYPDGFIVAAGDPDGVTRLSENYSRGENGNFLTVETVYKTTSPDYDATKEYELKPWKAGDKAILINTQGFYVFEVKEVQYQDETNDIIEMREQPVYYSGLLNTFSSRNDTARTYTDIDPNYAPGNTLTYDKATEVTRLTSFAIYLFQDITYPTAYGDRLIRQLVRVTDAKGQPDVLLGDSTAEKSIISENIYDMQISYRTYLDFTGTTPTGIDYFSGAGSYSDVATLMDEIKKRQLKQLEITLVSLTDEFAGKGEMDHLIPALGDEAEYTLPAGKYGCKILSLTIVPRNYNL
jgi:hypothetical protein